MDLSRRQQGIHNAARVVHGHVLQHADGPGFLGDLDHRHVSRKGIRAGAERIATAEIQPQGDPRWQLCAVVGSRGELGKGDVLLWVMPRANLPVLETEILHWAIEEMGRDQGKFLLGLVEYQAQGGAAGDQAAAGSRPSPHGHDRRIAVHHLDICGRHAQRIRHHLGEDGGRALAVR